MGPKTTACGKRKLKIVGYELEDMSSKKTLEYYLVRNQYFLDNEGAGNELSLFIAAEEADRYKRTGFRRDCGSIMYWE